MHLVVELACRDGSPRVADADLAQDQRAGGAALYAFFEQVGNRRVLVDAHQDGGVPFEGFGGRLRLRRLVVVGRGRGFFGGHVCSLVGGRVGPRDEPSGAAAPSILRARRVGERESL